MVRFSFVEIRNYLQELHDRYVFVPTDKASNNIAVICKYYYIKVLLKEIGLFDNKQKSAYISISENSQAIITQHVKNMEEVKPNIEEKSNNYQFYCGSLKCIRNHQNRDLLPLHIVVQPNQFQP